MRQCALSFRENVLISLVVEDDSDDDVDVSTPVLSHFGGH